MSHTAIVVLAAGNSTRLGSPKQLLPYQGTTLLGYTLQQLTSLPSCRVFVVLGAFSEKIKKEITALNVEIVLNPGWNSGMGSSLSKAVSEIQKRGDFDSVLVTLCDLPLLGTEFYTSLLKFHHSNRNRITRTSYPNTKGVPVIFKSSYFPELTQLQGDEGAKPLLKVHTNSIADFLWKEPFFDVDTPESYQELLLKKSN